MEEGSGSDRVTTDKPFMCGVCEGFYGKPWTTEQRMELFARMKRFGLNTYLYAPKDDYKHRLYWRDLYDQHEAEDLIELIEASKKHNVNFVYALSPGLDMTYSSPQELSVLKAKLDQVQDFGCQSFALLFDDIDDELEDDDAEMFDSFAHAQSVITNQIYQHMHQPEVFLFCPTEYCTSRAVPDLHRSEYLHTLGEKLHKGVDILWTGTKVVPRQIRVNDIEELKQILQRSPVIWDNLNANDYDQVRLYLGPYEGRPTQLRPHLHGVLTNPNCEFEANFVAMHTLAQWSKDTVRNFPLLKGSETTEMLVDAAECSSAAAAAEAAAAEEMEVDNCHDGPRKPAYNPKQALVCAVADWLPEFYKHKGATRKSKLPSGRAATDRDGHGDRTRMDEDGTASLGQTDDDADRSAADKMENKKTNDKNCRKDRKEKKKIQDIDPLNVSDLLLLCDLFYLPFEHGPRALHVLKGAHWLVSNTARCSGAQSQPIADHTPEVREWYERAVQFHEVHKDIGLFMDKVVNIPNRDMLYQLYNYVTDMRSVIGLVNSYIKWHGMGKPPKEPWKRNGEQEPWLNRGGLHTEFRRLLPLEGLNDVFPPVAKNETQATKDQVYTIRPYYSSDKTDVYNICRRTRDDRRDGSDLYTNHPDLPADEMIGGWLELYPQYCYVLENEAGVCGYVCAAPDCRRYQDHMEEHWLPQMRTKYPKPKAKGELSAEQASMVTFHNKPRAIPDALFAKYPGMICLDVLPREVQSVSTVALLQTACLKALKEAGSSSSSSGSSSSAGSGRDGKCCGVHTVVHSSHMCAITLYLKLGFDDVTDDTNAPDNMLVFGKPF